MSQERDRLERIAAAGQIWAYCYFFHPSLSTPDPSWQEVLINALPAVEEATSPEDFAQALNQEMLSALGAPGVVASVPFDFKRSPSGSKTTRAAKVPSKKLNRKTGYIDSTDIQLYARPDYVSLLGKALKRLGDIENLVIDLRWNESPNWQTPWPGFLGFAVPRPLPVPSSVSRVHTGWTETRGSVYAEVAEISPAATLLPLPQNQALFGNWMYKESKPGQVPAFNGKTVVIANQLSLPRIEPELLALKLKGRALLVFDPRGGSRSGLWGNVNVHHGGRYLSGGRYMELQADAVMSAGQDPFEVATRLLSKGGGKPIGKRASKRTLPPKDSELTRHRRVAALLKAWFVLKEFSPHHEFADLDFDKDLPAWIKRVEQASDKKSFVKTLAALASLMNDSHVGLWNQHTEIFGTHGPPIGLRYIEDKICVARVHPDASEMDINRGDEITHLDDRPIRDAANDLSRMISASTHSALNRSLFNRSWIMFGEQDSELVIDTKRGSRKKKVHLHRSLAVGDWVPEPSSDAVSRRLSSGVGYINLDSVESSEEFDKALRKLRSCPGLILDMRGYPRFGVQWDVVSRLIDVPVKGTQFLIPRRFAGSGQHSYHWSQYEIAPHKKLSYTGPLVVLIDENAQSASEDFCIYLQNAHRVTFVGSETSGTNGNVTTVNLGSGIGLTFTGMRVLFGNGSRFQNIGITPDVESLPTIKGWLAGRDEVLEAGEKILLQRAKKKPADGSSKTT